MKIKQIKTKTQKKLCKSATFIKWGVQTTFLAKSCSLSPALFIAFMDRISRYSDGR